MVLWQFCGDFSSVQSLSVSDSLWPHGLQHTSGDLDQYKKNVSRKQKGLQNCQLGCHIYVREMGQKIPLTTYIYILIDPGNQEIVSCCRIRYWVLMSLFRPLIIQVYLGLWPWVMYCHRALKYDITTAIATTIFCLFITQQMWWQMVSEWDERYLTFPLVLCVVSFGSVPHLS